MKATETLHDRGQSLWLDNITRDLVTRALANRASASSPSPPSAVRIPPSAP